MKYITLVGCFLCIVSCSIYGMKRPPKDDTILTTETCPPNKRARYTPETNQLLYIAANLNTALECLGNAQESTQFSTLGMQAQMSQLYEQVASSLNTSLLLRKYQSDINELSQRIQSTQHNLTHTLENAKSNLVDIYFTIPYSKHIRPILPQKLQIRPLLPNVSINAPIRAQDIYTAIVVPDVRTLSDDNEIEILEAS